MTPPSRSGSVPPLILFVMTAVTGVVDAVSFLALGHGFTANMTGNIVFLGFATAGAFGVSLPALLAFVLGAAAGTNGISNEFSSCTSLGQPGVRRGCTLLAGRCGCIPRACTGTGLDAAICCHRLHWYCDGIQKCNRAKSRHARSDYDGADKVTVQMAGPLSVTIGNIVPGVFTPVLPKHSKSLNLVDSISVGVDRMLCDRRL